MTCEHSDFTARVEVSRFDDRPGVFMADLTVCCSSCGQAMQFPGLPIGLLWDQPAANALGTEVRLPMRAFEKPEWISEEEHRLRQN